MMRFGNHPYVTYAAGPNMMGQLEIVCRCSACGAEWRRLCTNPQRIPEHVFRFAVTHGHGVQPVQPGARAR